MNDEGPIPQRLPFDPSTVGQAATAAYESTLDLEAERRAARRTETWILLRAILILVIVIAAVIARSLLL